MNLNQLTSPAGSNKEKKRRGRGMSSGLGKTSGRGQKGQKARSGVSLGGFEGGQNPLYRRLPKRGFTNIFAKKVEALTLDRLAQLLQSGKIDGKSTITLDYLKELSIVSPKADFVKIIGDTDPKAKLKFEGVLFSKKAAEILKI